MLNVVSLGKRPIRITTDSVFNDIKLLLLISINRCNCRLSNLSPNIDNLLTLNCSIPSKEAFESITRSFMLVSFNTSHILELNILRMINCLTCLINLSFGGYPPCNTIDLGEPHEQLK